MLLDTIGVAVGFSAVMLLLGLVVAALSQATQAALRLRGRNLRYGLACALMVTDDRPNHASLAESSDILNRSDSALLHHRILRESSWSRFLGPPVSWLNRADLLKVLRGKAAEINAVTKPPLSQQSVDAAIDDIVSTLDNADKSLSNRFKRLMRGISLAWAILVAALFQVSAPDLVNQMASDFARIDITPLHYGWAFYTDSSESTANITGVLATALLLTLGAPFWYRALAGLTFWQDKLGPPREDRS